ncbi:hypothetical protein BS50DRAFT_671254 [Corynespora cassiicola Philippines]|uniref:F-box domain-containing protein n=1 Tax=Corynespora cassiicola Philippines TaxID=1448308 RepID=A0A2T2PC90_CORCC|nr:hypothetical protein BS50DRAFT_671254 [Corynespora cassiicola Philippines]
MDTGDTPESSMLYYPTPDLPIPWCNESPIAVIPNELLLCIAECLDRTNLLNLSLVARCFRDIAQEVLFRHVDLYGPPASTLRSPYELTRPRRARAIEKFKWSLEQRPHLAAKVRTLKWDPLERVQSREFSPL